MPCDTSFVSPELFLSHAGVNVFHTYKNDDIAQGQNRYGFTLCDSNDEDGYFNVRELDVPSKGLLDGHPPYLSASSNPAFATASDGEKKTWEDQWAIWHETGEMEAIKTIIIEAIDLGILSNEDFLD